MTLDEALREYFEGNQHFVPEHTFRAGWYAAKAPVEQPEDAWNAFIDGEHGVHTPRNYFFGGWNAAIEKEREAMNRQIENQEESINRFVDQIKDLHKQLDEVTSVYKTFAQEQELEYAGPKELLEALARRLENKVYEYTFGLQPSGAGPSAIDTLLSSFQGPLKLIMSEHRFNLFRDKLSGYGIELNQIKRRASADSFDTLS